MIKRHVCACSHLPRTSGTPAPCTRPFEAKRACVPPGPSRTHWWCSDCHALADESAVAAAVNTASRGGAAIKRFVFACSSKTMVRFSSVSLSQRTVRYCFGSVSRYQFLSSFFARVAEEGGQARTYGQGCGSIIEPKRTKKAQVQVLEQSHFKVQKAQVIASRPPPNPPEL